MYFNRIGYGIYDWVSNIYGDGFFTSGFTYSSSKIDSPVHFNVLN